MKSNDDYILTIPGAPHGLPCDIGVSAYYPAERSVGKMSDSCEFDFIADDRVRDWLWNNLSSRALDAIDAICIRAMEADRQNGIGSSTSP